MENVFYFLLGVWATELIIVIFLSDNKKDAVEEPKPESPYVSCEDCKYLIKREDAQVVETETFNLYYCPKDKKPYDKKEDTRIRLVGLDGYSKDVIKYFKSNVEVDKNGKLIK